MKDKIIKFLVAAVFIYLGVYIFTHLAQIQEVTKNTPFYNKVLENKEETPKQTSITPAAKPTIEIDPDVKNLPCPDTKLIAKVQGVEICQSEVDEVMALIATNKRDAEKPTFGSLKDEEKQAVIKEAATRKILRNLVEKSNIANEKDIEEKISAVTYEIIKNEFLLRKAKESITPEKIKSYYDKMVVDMKDKDDFKFSHIMVGTEQEANEIYKILSKNPDKFAQLAKEKSQDTNSAQNEGSVGYVVQGSIIKELEDALNTMKKGQISTPIKSKLGWHIIKFEDRRPVKTLPFEDVKGKIENEIIQQNTANYLRSLLEVNIEMVE